MSRFHALPIAEVRRETADCVSVVFAVPSQLAPVFSFSPGQYLTLRTIIDGEDLRRSYSICSGAADGELRVAIKKVPDGLFSTHANTNLKPGDVLDVMPPEGRFVLPAREPAPVRRYLMVAAGSGITPILSLTKSILGRDPADEVTLVYGNRTSQSVIFSEQLEDLKNRNLGRLTLVHVFSREVQDVPLFNGRIDGQKIRALAGIAYDPATLDHAFLCGPADMIAACRAALLEQGVDANRIHSELFTSAVPSGPRRPRADISDSAPSAEIVVTLDGRRHVFPWHTDDAGLIDAAQRAGLELPYSCKGGMCCTCRCRVVEGEADMAVNYSLEPWEIAAGFTLACQARPKGERLTIDFDQM
jgi:ring-1,2-phenylacetyl-CoA epoxidase subunit PaaE